MCLRFQYFKDEPWQALNDAKHHVVKKFSRRRWSKCRPLPNIPGQFRMTAEQDRHDTMAKRTTCHKIIIAMTIMEITMVIVGIAVKKREMWHIYSQRHVEDHAVTICVWQFSFHYILVPLLPSTPPQCALLALLCTTSGTTCADF